MVRYLIKKKSKTKTIDYITVPKGTRLQRSNKGYRALKGKKKGIWLKGYKVSKGKSFQHAYNKLMK